GFEYVSVEDCGAESLVYHMRTNKGNIRAAALRVSGRAALKTNFDFLAPHPKHAPDYQATVVGLTHNDYVMHGTLRPALMPEKWPDPKGTRRTIYDRLCRHIDIPQRCFFFAFIFSSFLKMATAGSFKVLNLPLPSR